MFLSNSNDAMRIIWKAGVSKIDGKDIKAFRRAVVDRPSSKKKKDANASTGPSSIFTKIK